MRSRVYSMGILCSFGLAAWALTLQAADDEKLTDGAFVKKASSASMAEVKAGELALQKTNNARIKSFAQKMVEDHRKANKELEALAGRKGWPMPKTVDEKCQRELDKLASATAQDFDRTYAEGQLKAHEEAVKLFQAESEGGQDDSLKTWAGKTLPTLREHLQLAKDLSDHKDR
jgi:putative membrane protein